jgi:hypothetical protein
MFLELVGTFVAGIAAGLFYWAVNRTSGGRLPRWGMPVVAGAAMLAATISMEYGWYGRVTATLPAGVDVALTVEDSAPWRPWTYAAPMVTRFVAVDGASLRTHPEQPGQRMATLLFYGRWSPLAAMPALFDCPGARRADLIDGAEFGADGAVVDADWVTLAPDDPVLEAVCSAETAA